MLGKYYLLTYVLTETTENLQLAILLRVCVFRLVVTSYQSLSPFPKIYRPYFLLHPFLLLVFLTTSQLIMGGGSVCGDDDENVSKAADV